ncbi:hypothetical protein ABBQ38_009010 [Trebouxia sp. C0009 RCD-2024]
MYVGIRQYACLALPQCAGFLVNPSKTFRPAPSSCNEPSWQIGAVLCLQNSFVSDAIHKGEFTNPAELAAADRTDLEKLGIPKGAAGLIIAAAGGRAYCRTQVQRLCGTEELNTEGGVCMQCPRSSTGSSRHLMQVWESETKQLQPRLHTLFVKHFEGFEVRSATDYEAEADERMIYNSMDIGAWELKVDTNGNIYGQIQRYYVAVVQSLQQARSPVLALSCVPMLYMELSGATLRVCGAATLQHQFLCEPLTPALHLYCVNNPAHMDAVVRCVSAIRRTVSKLATFHQQLAAQASPTPYQQTPSACLPYYFATAYPEASVQQLLAQTRLIFLVTTTNGQQRLVKFVPFCQNRSQGGTQAHRAWADAQCAPDLLHVESLCGQWYVVEMEYLAPRNGWFPLYILAPQRGQTVPMQAGSQPEPLSAPAWQRASALAAQALEHAQQHATVLLDGHKHPTVHGDVRLPNIIGHVVDGSEVDRVVFVDFDWAGLQGITRYPALMNPDIAWPTGAQPFARLQQVHDKELMYSELQKGSAT